MILLLLACARDLETCVPTDVSGCDDVQSCCTALDCHYEADGEDFDCDGVDCTEAAEELAEWCQDS